MGKYINKTSKCMVGSSARDKCLAILEDGGVEIDEPKNFIQNLVCVVDNGYFGAAAYAYSEQEMKCFQNSSDTRNKRWFIWENVILFAE